MPTLFIGNEDMLGNFELDGTTALIFLHGHCEYFALALAEKYGYKIILWLDGSEEDDSVMLMHAFNVVEVDGREFYVDVRGVTTELVVITEAFDYWEEPEPIGLSIGDAKEILDGLKIPYDDERLQYIARTYIKDNEERYRVSAESNKSEVGA